MKGWALDRLVFIDESGAKTNMTRLRGRAPKGDRAHDSAPLACLHRTPEVGVGQLGGFILAHDGSSM